MTSPQLHTTARDGSACAPSHTSCTDEPHMTSPSLGVLVVSGDALVTGSLEHMLSQARGTRVQRATTIASACAKLSEQWIDAVVVDLAMIDGTELTELTRVGQPEPLTVLGVLRQDCALRTTEALRAGAQECLLFSDLTTDRLMRSLRQGIERQRVQQRLADLALRDELTGLYNRRGFFAIGEHLRRECLRNARDLARRAGRRRRPEGDQRFVRPRGRRSGDRGHRRHPSLHVPRVGRRRAPRRRRVRGGRARCRSERRRPRDGAPRRRARAAQPPDEGTLPALVQRGIIRADAARASDAQRPPRQRGPRAVCATSAASASPPGSASSPPPTCDRPSRHSRSACGPAVPRSSSPPVQRCITATHRLATRTRAALRTAAAPPDAMLPSRNRAKVAELADALDLGSSGRKAVGVRLPPFALALGRIGA